MGCAAVELRFRVDEVLQSCHGCSACAKHTQHHSLISVWQLMTVLSVHCQQTMRCAAAEDAQVFSSCGADLAHHSSDAHVKRRRRMTWQQQQDDLAAAAA
jgi:flavoprotein